MSLVDVVRQVLSDVSEVLPLVTLSVLLLLVFFIVVRIMNNFVRLLVEKSRIEEFVEENIGKLPISIKAASIFVMDLGLALLWLGLYIQLVVPIDMRSYLIEAGSKIASVIIIGMVGVLGFESIIRILKRGDRYRGFVAFAMYLMTLVLLIELSGMSSETKLVLSAGLSFGLGLLIGFFALWYFFFERG